MVNDQLHLYDQKEALEVWRSQRGLECLPTGIPSLDAATGGGLPVRQLTCILGAQKVGKSEVVRQFRRNAVAAGYPVVHLDVELGLARIMEREICQLGGIDAMHLRKGLLTKDELESFRRVEAQLESESGVLTICPGNMLPTVALTQLIEGALAEFTKPALIILDSLQRFALGADAGSFREKTANFLLWAEQFAHSHNAAMLMTSERNRPPPGVETKIEDAVATGAESRAIEYYSDLLLVLHPVGSMDEARPDEAHDRIVRMAILASRVGVTGWIKHDLRFHYPTWGFSLRAHDSAHVSEKEIEGATKGLRIGMKYTAKELQAVWGFGQLKAKTLIEALVASKELNKIGRCYSLPPSAVEENA